MFCSLQWYQKFTEVDDVIPISAKYGQGVDDVKDWILSKLPLGPAYYPKVCGLLLRANGSRAIYSFCHFYIMFSYLIFWLLVTIVRKIGGEMVQFIICRSTIDFSLPIT